MASKYAPEAYQEMQVIGSDPRQLVVLLCQALVRYLIRTEDAIKREDWETKADSVNRAQQILSELICSLDEEVGGELAEQLRALYAHLQRQLVDVDLQDDLDRLDYVMEIATKLANAWEEALERCQEQQMQERAA
jgi:flagellar protein FliS